MAESVEEQIIQKLSIFDVSKLRKGLFAPHESTQAGLAEATDMNVASISRHLASLRKQGIIKSKLMNVQGRPRKVQCHYLTKKGMEMVNPALSGEQAQYLAHTPHAGIMDAMNRIAQEGELLQQLFTGKETRSSKIESIQALNRISRLYASVNQTRSALNFAVQAYVLAEQLEVRKHLVPTLENLVEVLRTSGNYTQAREHAQRLVDLDPTPGHYALMGTCVWRTGDYKGAIAFLEAAERMLGTGDDELRFHVYNNLGTIYNELGDHERALEYYNMYLSMKPRDMRRASKILNNIGMLFYFRGRYKEAIPYFEEMLKIAEGKDMMAMGYAYVNMAYCFAQAGEIERALETNGKGRDIFTRLGDQNMLAGATRTEGVIARKQGNFDLSLRLLEQALTVFQVLRIHKGEEVTHLDIAETLRLKGDNRLAREHVRMAGEIGERMGARTGPSPMTS